MSDAVKIYHNPRCSKSRDTLSLLKANGIDPEVVLYLETPPDAATLRQLLKMLMQMHQPQTVVEIGTYSGYSALAMASGMPPGARVLTFEINDEQECFTRPWLEGAPYEARVEMFVGNVFELLPPMQLRIDAAFIDANKREYVEYYNLLMPFMHSGSLILADNTLWDGHVVDPAYDRDAQTVAIRRFNDMVAADDRVEQLILPERDGLSVIRVK